MFAGFNFCDVFLNPQKIIPRKNLLRKNLLHYWNYRDYYLMQKYVCVYLFKSSLSFKNKTIEL